MLLLCAAANVSAQTEPIAVVNQFESLMQQWCRTKDGAYREQIEQLLRKSGRECIIADKISMKIDMENKRDMSGSIQMATYLNYIEDKIDYNALQFDIDTPRVYNINGDDVVYAWVNYKWRESNSEQFNLKYVCGFTIRNGSISSIFYDASMEMKWMSGDFNGNNSNNNSNINTNINTNINSSSTIIPITIRGTTYGNMILVKGGTFSMGATSEQGSDADSDEKPVHTVTLSNYYIGETEVTCGLWKAVMGSDPSYFKKGDNYPVERVSWDDCQEFIKKLNSLTDKTFRLPTEAEWEYAARGGSKSRGYKYSGSNDISSVAVYDKNSYDLGSNNSNYGTHRVKSKSPNELGLYDMSGNVYEWCSDWYKSDYYANSPSTNPQGPSPQSYRVLRGGSWNGSAGFCRVSNRSNIGPSNRSHDLGFRLALVP